MVITRTTKGTYQDAWSRKEYESQREARIAKEAEIVYIQEKRLERHKRNNKRVRLTRRVVQEKYPVTNEMIRDILDKELKNVELSAKPVYNNKIKSDGKTSAHRTPIGTTVIDKIEIGKQQKGTREYLIDTLLHEELEARIAKKAFKSEYHKRLDTASDEERHQYIGRVIKRFFDLKGIDYDMGQRG